VLSWVRVCPSLSRHNYAEIQSAPNDGDPGGAKRGGPVAGEKPQLAAVSWFGRRFGALPGDRREPLRANVVASGGNNPNQIDEVRQSARLTPIEDRLGDIRG
jgi:hypothetical protein